MKEVWKTVIMPVIHHKHKVYAIVYIATDGTAVSHSPLTPEQQEEINNYYKENYRKIPFVPKEERSQLQEGV